MDEIWAGQVGETMHKHDFNGPWINGKWCEECPAPLGTIEIVEVDTATGSVTIKTIPDKT